MNGCVLGPCSDLEAVTSQKWDICLRKLQLRQSHYHVLQKEGLHIVKYESHKTSTTSVCKSKTQT